MLFSVCVPLAKPPRTLTTFNVFRPSHRCPSGWGAAKVRVTACSWPHRQLGRWWELSVCVSAWCLAWAAQAEPRATGWHKTCWPSSEAVSYPCSQPPQHHRGAGSGQSRAGWVALFLGLRELKRTHVCSHCLCVAKHVHSCFFCNPRYALQQSFGLDFWCPRWLCRLGFFSLQNSGIALCTDGNKMRRKTILRNISGKSCSYPELITPHKWNLCFAVLQSWFLSRGMRVSLHKTWNNRSVVSVYQHPRTKANAYTV